MKFTITKKELVRASERATRIASKKSPLAMLTSVAIIATVEGVYFLASDLSLSVTSRAQADVITDGSVCVEAAALAKLAKSLPDVDVTFAELKGGVGLEIKAGRSKSKLPCMPADDFPPLPKPGAMAPIPAPVIARLLNGSRLAMASEGGRPDLQCVFLDSVTMPGWLTAVASDSKRLMLARAKVPFRLTVTVPSYGVTEIIAICERAEDVEMAHDEGVLFVRHEGVTLGVKLADGFVLPFEKIIPKSAKHSAVVDRASIIDAIKRVSLFGGEHGLVTMSLANDLITVDAKSSAGDGEESVPCDYAGEGVTTTASARYVLDALSVVADDQCTIEANGARDAIVIRGLSGTDGLSVTMPVSL